MTLDDAITWYLKMKPIQSNYIDLMKSMSITRPDKKDGEGIFLGFVFDLETLPVDFCKESSRSDLLTIFRQDFEGGREFSWYNWITDDI